MTLKSTTSALVYTAVSTALLLGASVAGAATATTATKQPATNTSPTIRGNGVAGGLTLPNQPIYALTSDNAIYVLKPGASNYVRLGRVET